MIDERQEFDAFLKIIDRAIPIGRPILEKIHNKDWIPLIDSTLKEKPTHYIFENLLRLLINSKNEISDSTIFSLFEDVVNPKDKKFIPLRELCSYIVVFNKREYCDIFKKILEIYGTKKFLVDNTSAMLVDVLIAVKELGCINCYNSVKEIVSFGSSMNPWVLLSAKDALRSLEVIKE